VLVNPLVGAVFASTVFDSPPPAPDPRGGKGEEAGRRLDLAEEGHAAAESRERGGGGGAREREERAAGRGGSHPSGSGSDLPSLTRNRRRSPSSRSLRLHIGGLRVAPGRSREGGRGGEGERATGRSTAVGEA
jgi:hypothetical protein